MRKVTFFYRNIKVGYSINKVFHTITSQFENKEELQVPCYRANFISLFRNLLFVWKHRDKNGINHITGDIHYCIIALIGCTTVLTIHDTSAYDHAKSSLKRLFIKYFWFRIPLLLADKVVCISEYTKRSVERFTKREDILVIYNPIDPVFRESTRSFNSLHPNILLVGTAWNKNILRTLEAVSNINCHVTIIGKLSNDIISKLDSFKIMYSNKIDLTDEEIFIEYCNCDIVCFCSLYEGFGMPIIEANKVRRNIVTSHIPPLREIASDSALYVNPYNVNEISCAITSLISDEILREKLLVNGDLNILKFNLSFISKQYSLLYTNFSF